MTTEIYLDGNATSAVMPAALAAAMDAMQRRYGNPSSTHATGLQARAILDQTRACAMRLLGVGDGRLMFNSGATEGIQTAMLSALVALRERRARGEAIGSLLLYGATEHKAVPESLAHWNRLLGLNLSLQTIPVGADGRHDLAALRALAGRAALVCTMAANNETGVISDLDGIAAVLADSGTAAYWLVDCVQALGKLKLDLAATRIDYAPFSGHKLYAPKGVGMLYVRAGAPFTPLMMGGGQEAGLRSGTENMAGVAALGAVLAALEEGGTFRSHAQLASFRARLADSLRAALPGVVFNHAFDTSLPTTLNFSVPGVASRELMDVFDAAQVRVSSGSACSAAKAAPSYVLDAMGAPLWRSSGAIRMSFGPLVDAATIAEACARIEHCGAALRAGCLIPADAGAGPRGSGDKNAAALTQQAAHDGLLQIGVDGACSWLLLDAASRACVVIDALPDTTQRIASYVRCQDYRVLAIVGTAPDSDRTTLAEALGSHFDQRAPVDAYGWPERGHGASSALSLEDGAGVDSLQLGGQVLASLRFGHAAGAGAAALAASDAASDASGDAAGEQRAYLLGRASGARLPAAAVYFAFGASAARSTAALAGVTGAATLLCVTRDPAIQHCTSMHAQQQLTQPQRDSGAQLEALLDSALLESALLESFLHLHPDALLIDVREPYEFAATLAPGPGGRNALSVPLGRLAEYASAWLRAERAPLLFFCRSGKRSAQAAHCLRRLGYEHAYHLGGGLALASVALAA